MAMGARSAGLLPYRARAGQLEVLIAHMGGPLWARREEGAWTIVKGEHDEREDPLAAARREFQEETGTPPPGGQALELGEVRQSGGKRVSAWAVEAELDPTRMRSNTFELEWPPRSGRVQEFPEVDRFEWNELPLARRRVVKAQAELLDRLERLLRAQD
jgi:predicted NUDIX family NTP pyrophosphohydrolase